MNGQAASLPRLAVALRACPTLSRRTLLYVVQEDVVGGKVKIGHTNGDVRHRLRVLQNGNPRPLRIIATFLVHPFAERDMHHMLDRVGARVRGEWFDPHPEVFRIVDIYREAGFSWS